MFLALFIGLHVSEEHLKEAVSHSNVLELPDDFLEPEFGTKCECLIPNREEIEAEDCKQAYLNLKANFSLPIRVH